MPNKRFLIVEDHSPTSDAVADYLRTFFPDWEIGQATSQKEGLRKLIGENPDVVILDIALPDGDGLDLVRKRAKASIESKARFVVMTALGNKAVQGPRPGQPWMDQLENDEKVLVTAFFEKPFLWKEFLTALAKAGNVPAPEALTEFQEF